MGYRDELRGIYGADHMVLTGVEKHSDERRDDLLCNRRHLKCL